MIATIAIYLLWSDRFNLLNSSFTLIMQNLQTLFSSLDCTTLPTMYTYHSFMVECLAPIPVPLYLIIFTSSFAQVKICHKLRKLIHFRRREVCRAWSGSMLLSWDPRSSHAALLNSLPCWSRITALCDLTLSLPTPCGMKNHLRGLFTAATHDNWFKINIRRTSHGVPMQYRICQRREYCSWTRKTTVPFSKRFWGFEVYLFSNKKWQQGLLKFSEAETDRKKQGPE